jgi:hypothetical protein
MNRLGQQFLAGPGLTQEQDREILLGRAAGQGQTGLKSGGTAD